MESSLAFHAPLARFLHVHKPCLQGWGLHVEKEWDAEPTGNRDMASRGG